MTLEFFDGAQWRSVIPSNITSSRPKAGKKGADDGRLQKLEQKLLQLQQRVQVLEAAVQKQACGKKP